MSGQAAGSVFDRFGSRKYRSETTSEAEASPQESAPPPLLGAIPLDEPSLPSGKVSYQALQIDRSKSQTRLRIHYANGHKVRMLSYAYLIEVVSTSHQWLSLVFTSTVVTLKGRNLDSLMEFLQDEKVRGLTCFHPGKHQPPASNEPCILEITDLSLHEAADEKKN